VEDALKEELIAETGRFKTFALLIMAFAIGIAGIGSI